MHAPNDVAGSKYDILNAKLKSISRFIGNSFLRIRLIEMDGFAIFTHL